MGEKKYTMKEKDGKVAIVIDMSGISEERKKAMIDSIIREIEYHLRLGYIDYVLAEDTNDRKK